MSTEAGVEEKKSVQVSDKLQGIIQSIETLTVIELANLVKALEEKFGVSAQAAVAVAAPGAAAGAGAAAVEEKTSFQVVLVSAGEKKIQVIKEIRAITNLGLKEAKDLVESAPKPIKDNASKEEAEKIKAQVESAGAKVEIK
jgi:large subunit ribosomal protein L7/L12